MPGRTIARINGRNGAGPTSARTKENAARKRVLSDRINANVSRKMFATVSEDIVITMTTTIGMMTRVVDEQPLFTTLTSRERVSNLEPQTDWHMHG